MLELGGGFAPDGAALALGGALLVDTLAGEYPNALHPVCWMGRVIQGTSQRALEARPLRQLALGAAIALGVPAVFAAGAVLLERALAAYPLLLACASILLLKATFAIRALGRAAAVMSAALDAGDLAAARRALGSLCSRDAAGLEAPALAAGTIESVAENLADSVVAPLFYFLLFGLPGAVAYRCINTADAMIGYHGRWELVGKAAARLDDLASFIPARLSAALLLAAGLVCGADVQAGARIWRRDARKTESPNAGRPMAAMAGLLGVQLEKAGHYVLGDAGGPLDARAIDRAWALCRVAAWLWALAVLVLAGALH
jgi:adenosylcobinamide-phosphate synthase